MADTYAFAGPPERPCPMASALAQISGKWKPRLLHRLMGGEAQFLQLLRDFPGMNRKVLAEQLGALVRDGLVERREQGDARGSVCYRLSVDGQRLGPVLAGLYEWSLGRDMRFAVV